jgi:hypothetical protein
MIKLSIKRFNLNKNHCQKRYTMNKYTATLLLLASASSAQAVDDFDFTKGTLTIPSVIVGPLTYSNVSVQLKDYTVLSYDQHPANGLVINEDDRIKIDLIDLSRFESSIKTNGKEVNFSLRVNNKTNSRIYIASDNGANISALADEKGKVCDNRPVTINSQSYPLRILGVAPVNLATSSNIGNYTTIEPSSQRTVGVSSDKTNCGGFFGNVFSFESYLWVYDEANSKASLLSYAFRDVPIPQ